MEAVAVDKLIEKAHFHPDVALAIAEAMDITIQAHNFVTVPMMETRFATLEMKVEARFARLEQSIADAKAGALKLSAALVVALFGALGADHYWLISREDQMQMRSDQRFQLVDDHFKQVDVRFQEVDKRFAQVDKRFEQMDGKLEEIRALLIARHRPSRLHRH